MAELNIPRAHSNDWYDNLSAVQDGYFYPWQSNIGDGDGETAYLEKIKQLITPESTVLEVGCGHGELALLLAPFCKRIIAYDRVASYIEKAQTAQKKQNINNVEFLCRDAQLIDEVLLPVENNTVDVIIGRRAPLHWIADATRVCRPGATLLSLCPMEEPIPAWSSKLPKKLHYENSGRHTGSGSIHQSVSNRLHQAGLTLGSGWGFDVPESFKDPKELFTMLTWGLPKEELPDFEDIELKLSHIYEKYADSTGIVLRHCRYMWQAQVNG